MTTLTEIMSDHHAWCDARIHEIASDVDRSAWADARTHSSMARHALEWHIGAEETTLFPAFETATGNPRGPTEVMRHEHERIRALFAACDAAIEQRRAPAATEAIARLKELLNQHNLKEERILYPWCEQALGERVDSVVTELEARIREVSPGTID